MKRTALVRKTPLRARVGLKPHAPKRAKTRPSSTPSTEERTVVLNRDRMCIVRILQEVARFPTIGRFAAGDISYSPCADQWGEPITVWSSANLTYEHVRTEAGGYRPRADDGIGRMFAVACCAGHNLSHWTSQTEARLAVNALLDALYPNRGQYLP